MLNIKTCASARLFHALLVALTAAVLLLFFVTMTESLASSSLVRPCTYVLYCRRYEEDDEMISSASDGIVIKIMVSYMQVGWMWMMQSTFSSQISS